MAGTGAAFFIQKRSGKYLLFLAAISLTVAGWLFRAADARELGLACLATFFLVYVVYGFNDFADREAVRLVSPVGLAVGFVAFIALLFRLPSASVQALVAIFVMGILYSIPLSPSNHAARIKNLYGVKNAVIGAGWGLLVIVGAATWSSRQLLAFVAFVALQVFIGSAIRDMNDVEEDRRDRVQTLPVVHGIAGAVRILMQMNGVSGVVLVLASFAYPSAHLFPWLLVAVVWRHFTLAKIGSQGLKPLYLLHANLFTCFLITACKGCSLWI